jgi:hypothetical protein
MICPVCVANAAMAVAGVSASTGGVTTVAMRLLRWKKNAPKPSQSAGIARQRPGPERMLAAGRAAQRQPPRGAGVLSRP